ncbi:glycosyltransferase family 39 protein, partial [Patescibacteria group bacterium]|nr:glycosyltransferase family 39 protein [Patescibacteria group bacterium]
MSNKKLQIILAFIILIFLAIKIPQIDFRYGDENIYFQMGNLIAQGQLPYQDFFLASPPLQVLLIALVIFLFGFNIYLLKLIPLLCLIGSAIFIYKILACEKEKLAGLFASFLYLFSFLVLTTSDYFSGVHLTVFLCIFSIYLLLKNQPVWAGILSALALLTRFYAGPIILVIFICALIQRKLFANPQTKNNWWKFFLTSGLIFIGINLILYLIFKQNYISDVLLYHLLKFEEQSRLAILQFFLNWDWPLLILAGLSFFIIKIKKLILPIIGIITTGLFLYIFKDIYYLYFNLAMPFIVILAGFLLAKIIAISLSCQKYFIYFISSGIILALALLSFSHINFYLKDHADSARIDYIKDLNNFIISNSNL